MKKSKGTTYRPTRVCKQDGWLTNGLARRYKSDSNQIQVLPMTLSQIQIKPKFKFVPANQSILNLDLYLRCQFES